MIIFCLFFASCSGVQVQSSGTMPTSLGLKDKHGTPVEVLLTREFYLWGFLPLEHKVELDRELDQLGIVGAAHIYYGQYQTWSQSFLTLATLGLYRPVTIRIRALAETVEDKQYVHGRWR